jgi:hypothetical protein
MYFLYTGSTTAPQNPLIPQVRGKTALGASLWPTAWRASHTALRRASCNAPGSSSKSLTPPLRRFAFYTIRPFDRHDKNLVRHAKAIASSRSDHTSTMWLERIVTKLRPTADILGCLFGNWYTRKGKAIWYNDWIRGQVNNRLCR